MLLITIAGDSVIADWQELSKESFRQGEELSEVEKKYGNCFFAGQSNQNPQAGTDFSGKDRKTIPRLIFKSPILTRMRLSFPDISLRECPLRA